MFLSQLPPFSSQNRSKNIILQWDRLTLFIAKFHFGSFETSKPLKIFWPYINNEPLGASFPCKLALKLSNKISDGENVHTHTIHTTQTDLRLEIVDSFLRIDSPRLAPHKKLFTFLRVL